VQQQCGFLRERAHQIRERVDRARDRGLAGRNVFVSHAFEIVKVTIQRFAYGAHVRVLVIEMAPAAETDQRGDAAGGDDAHAVTRIGARRIESITDETGAGVVLPRPAPFAQSRVRRSESRRGNRDDALRPGGRNAVEYDEETNDRRESHGRNLGSVRPRFDARDLISRSSVGEPPND
jgi:hypothetical protein